MSNGDFKMMIEPLNRNNYVSWAEDLRAVLLERGGWGIVTGTEEPPTKDTPPKEVKDYQTRVNKSYTAIYLNIEKELRCLVSETINPKEAWDTLKEYFQPKSRARLMGLLDTFFKSCPEEGESVGLYAARLRKLIVQIKEAGHKLDDMFQAFQLIRNLPPEFSNIVANIYRWKDEDFVLDKVLKDLICEESRIQQVSADSETYNSNFVSNVNFKKKPINKKTSSPTKPKPKQCSKCQKLGHLAPQCRVKKKNFAANLETSFVVESGLNTENSDPNLWIFDTAATSHFANDKSLFQNFKTVQNREMSVAVGDSTYPIEGVGDIVLSFDKQKEPLDLTLRDVMYSPRIKKNLMAGSKFDQAKAKFVGGNGKLTIFSASGQKLFTTKKSDGLYKCWPNVKSNLGKRKVKISANTVRVQNSDFETWHRKFNHINSKFIISTSKNESVRGLPIFKHFKFSCHNCRLAKTKRQSHKPICGPRSRKPLELVHSDLCGPFPTKSIGGHLYFLTFIDDFSRKVVVYPIKDKTSVFDTFLKFQKRAERFLNLKLINLRTDNGLEYCHNDFKKFLESQGIHAERTNVVTPQMNGVAERFNLTAVDAIKTILNDSKLQKSFWSEALLSFTYTWNRVCHAKQTKTPFELYGGQKPSVKHLIAFGTKAYVAIPKSMRKKLDLRAKEGVMVGYAMQTRGYRVWIPSEHKIIETNDVRFEKLGDGGKLRNVLGNKTEFQFSEEKNSETSSSDEEDLPLEVEPEKTPGKSSTFVGLDPSKMKWRRRAILRKDKKRWDIYYDLEMGPGEKPIVLNSCPQAEKFCRENNLIFDNNFFNFSGKNQYNGPVTGTLEKAVEPAQPTDVSVPQKQMDDEKDSPEFSSANIEDYSS